jgi:hypothetical protein
VKDADKVNNLSNRIWEGFNQRSVGLRKQKYYTAATVEARGTAMSRA